jgi:hypothetical protein
VQRYSATGAAKLAALIARRNLDARFSQTYAAAVEPQIGRGRCFVLDLGTPTASVASSDLRPDRLTTVALAFRALQAFDNGYQGRFPAMHRGEAAAREPVWTVHLQLTESQRLASSARPVDHGGALGNGGVTAGSGGALRAIWRSCAASARSRSVRARACGGGSPGCSGMGDARKPPMNYRPQPALRPARASACTVLLSAPPAMGSNSSR